ncbi:hypothetical protein [Gemmata sp.]|uniref:hypothetical protein n=1 Tax=Gemmata sp. TaxID=1914242 RepID=UPI003F6FD0E4
MSSTVPARPELSKSPHVRPRPRPRPAPRRRSIGSPAPCPECAGDRFFDVSSAGTQLVCPVCTAFTTAPAA